ncbi:hypothetical protein CHS0354_013628 [Potamilus streckersoni]|uniref:SCP domain-containing protein n=1 Tax=Potamilus streckersoni TaxID=2493646 RepID=A0AAE0VYK5_9BIVA|nr:hypothetical protein CHS0354_013628 [Potamilus streckersoni]
MLDQKFIDEVVNAHNEYRFRHQAPPIKHAKDLSEYAQKWADHLVASNTFQHSPCDVDGTRLGENIAMKWSTGADAFTGQEATDQWYREVKLHQFGVEPGTLSSGHFTQVVWVESKEIGVGKAKAKDGKIVVVASYRPAGNMMGEFAKNVLPPKDGKIILPAEKAPSSSAESMVEKPPKERQSPFSSQFEDGKCGIGDSSSSSGGNGTENRTTKTYTVTEGSGPNAVTKTITEETIIKPDGSKVTTKKITTSTGGGALNPMETENFEKMRLDDGNGKKKVKGSKKKGSSSSSSDSSPESKRSQKLSEFIDDAVKSHNEYRKLHGVGPLKHAKDLSEFAQKWAEHLAVTDSFQHSDCTHKGERIGENIACKWSSTGADYTGQQATDQWYSEISKHDFTKEPRSSGTGHFTQVVWKESKEMGIGKAKTSGGKVIVVGNYRPAGNLVGHYVENVPPPKK